MKNVEKRFYIFLLIWLCVDFVQAIFTNIHADEAYYALYGQFLAWGYYDHPPMVALLTYLSHFFDIGNLSVRFCTVLLHAVTLLLVWKTIHDEKASIRDVNEFFLLASSLFMFVLYGFVTTPDAPLLFFVALFFFLYKRYLSNPSLPLALLIGVCMAGMMYSKYMAVLVIAFVLLSNLKLLKDWRLWLSVVCAVALFVPHILWQFNNDFPSLKYHLLLRKDTFSWAYPLEYLPNQLLVFNPVCFGLALYFCWKSIRNAFKGRDAQPSISTIPTKACISARFTRACVFTCIGFVFFFWLMTINGHAEPHWTIAISIPMLYLLYYQTREEKWRKRLMYFVLPFSVLVLVVRVALCTPFVPEVTGFGDRKQQMKDIHELCGQTPVVFYTSFQNPSLYRYFTHENAVALSSLYNRPTQYDILQLDKEWQGKEVFVVSSNDFLNCQKMENYELYYNKIHHFQGTNRIEIEIAKQAIERDSVVLDVIFRNNYAEPFVFAHPECPVLVFAAHVQEEGYMFERCDNIGIQKIPANGSASACLRFPWHPGMPIAICLSNHLNLSVNSGVVEVK